SNPDDLYKLLTVCNNAGGLTPNKAKEIALNSLGETSEDYPGEWGNIPLAYQKTQGSGAGTGQDINDLAMSLQKQIEKAASHNDDAVVAVMKEVRSLLLKIDKGA
ncbi:MAG: phage portal protein, partial [Oscillospiraceae bacterium]|nr:phage portal protein [Oscillospiraceae bacterium]